MNKNIEVLAPCGSFESVVAAVRCGADAIYMGTKNFNARIKADNFDEDDLEKAISYCHGRNVRVNITLNTLINNSELTDVTKTLEHVCRKGADVLILQDLGLSQYVRKAAPQIEMHASTQMSVQTLSGVELLKELGFKRVVLPREMTKAEIENIKKNTDCEIEIFVHGALCMCVSGQCYMSSMFGSRSGNRGLCAQPCRLPFSAPGGTGYDLSLKDLSLAHKARELEEIGIDSLKIEGRMKRPEYVAAAVTCINKALHGEDTRDISEKLRAVFSRSGFTDGYYENRRGKNMFGTRKKEDVTSATNSLLTELSHLYDKEAPLVPVSFYLTVVKDEEVSLSASAMDKTVFVTDSYVPEKAINKPMTKEGLTERLAKCGGTQFFAESVEIELDEGLIVPASVINDLRRRALSELDIRLSTVKPITFTTLDIKPPVPERKSPLKYRIRISDISQLPDNLQNVENLYFPLSLEENSVEKLKNLPVKLGVELPRGIFGAEKAVENRLLKMKECGISVAYCGTIDALAIAKKLGFEIHTGFSLNIFNSLSASVLDSLGVKEITLSPELTLKQASLIYSKAKAGIIAYGRLPLMLTRNCPIKNGRACEECKGNSYLTDRMNKKFPVVCSWGCSEILNSQPVYMGDRMDEIENLDFITFYFTKEKKELCEAVLDAYRKKKSVSGDITRGLYYRGAL